MDLKNAQTSWNAELQRWEDEANRGEKLLFWVGYIVALFAVAYLGLVIAAANAGTPGYEPHDHPHSHKQATLPHDHDTEHGHAYDSGYYLGGAAGYVDGGSDCEGSYGEPSSRSRGMSRLLDVTTLETRYDSDSDSDGSYSYDDDEDSGQGRTGPRGPRGETGPRGPRGYPGSAPCVRDDSELAWRGFFGKRGVFALGPVGFGAELSYAQLSSNTDTIDVAILPRYEIGQVALMLRGGANYWDTIGADDVDYHYGGGVEYSMNSWFGRVEYIRYLDVAGDDLNTYWVGAGVNF